MKSNLPIIAFCIVCLALLPNCKKSEQAPPTGTASSPGANQSGEAFELKAKWPVGNKYTYRLDLEQKTKMQIPGMAAPMQQDVNMAQTYSLAVVKERPSDGRELELQFVAMEMDINMGGMNMSFDSKTDDKDSAANNPFLAPYRKIMGSKLRMFVDGKGKLESIENLDEWQNTVLDGSSPQAEGMIRSTFSPEYFRQLVETAKGMPERPVKIGESWPFKTEVPTGTVGTITLDMKVTLKGFEQHENHHCAALQSSGKINGKLGTPGPMGNTSIEQGTVNGTMWFDAELGAVVGVKSDQEMKLKIEPPAGAPIGGKTLSGDVMQKITVNLVELGKAG